MPPPHAVLLGKERDRWPLEARLICAAHDGSVRKIKKTAKELDVHGHGIPATVASTTNMGMNMLDISPSRITATIFTKRCTSIQVEYIQQSKVTRLKSRVHDICFRRSVPSLQTNQYYHYKKEVQRLPCSKFKSLVL
ncbi:uncharacterized protein LOC119354768 [Triticum dicoccoides]|uniref:uncharacterized protein LOC119354768 n=1 Tax=Triticum dicoccoides TaxID=85692 RepID=UPI00188E0A48|nr:uncharacterized protein LOC119354768 [Triticum dicoccoides]